MFINSPADPCNASEGIKLRDLFNPTMIDENTG